jgi:flagellar basal body-associated protein FliL
VTDKPTPTTALKARVEQLETDRDQTVWLLAELAHKHAELDTFLRQLLAQATAQAVTPLLEQQIRQQLNDAMATTPLSQLQSQLGGGLNLGGG